MRREAVGQFQTILRAEPTNDDARISYGRLLSYTRHYKESEAQFNDVLRRNPHNDEALVGLGNVQQYSGHPFDAKSTYQTALSTNSSSTGAKQGLSDVYRQTVPSVTAYVSNYSDTNGVHLRAYGFGPTYRTRNGAIGLTYENGSFRDNGADLRRRALNLLLQHNFGTTQARLLLNQVHYAGAPNRNLYDLTVQHPFGPRTRVYGIVAKRDVIESLGAVTQGITAQELSAGFDYPIANRLDLEAELTRLHYSDSNNRTTLTGALMYRILTAQPVLRVGLGIRRDNTSFISPLYYTPQDYSALAALADYSIQLRRLRASLSGAYPLSGGNNGGINRPARTLFGSLSYDASDALELFVNGGIVDAPTFNSNTVTAGVNFYFGG